MFLFLIVLFYIVVKSKNLNNNFINIIDNLSQRYEYTFLEAEINDLFNIKSSEIEKYFNEYYGKSIFLIPLRKISKKLITNNWIDAVSIKSDYKNRINVIITEAKPIGIYYDEYNYNYHK